MNMEKTLLYNTMAHSSAEKDKKILKNFKIQILKLDFL